MAMALSGEQLRRRVRAAAALDGHGMREVRGILKEFGAPKTLAEAMARGDTPQSPSNLLVLAEALGVPRAWFEVEDARELIRPADSPIDSQLGALETRMEYLAKEIVERLDRALAGQTRQLTRLAQALSSLEALQSQVGLPESSSAGSRNEPPS